MSHFLEGLADIKESCRTVTLPSESGLICFTILRICSIVSFGWGIQIGGLELVFVVLLWALDDFKVVWQAG